MKTLRHSQKLLIFVAVAGLLLCVHHFIFRPIFLEWGAPASLQAQKLPGDTITGGTGHTRAILIHATPEEIWPWIVQIGQDRGGFYSYQWLENIFRSNMKNVYALKPELQFPRQVGDTVWLASKHNYNGRGYQIVAQVTPFKSFVMVGGEDYIRLEQGDKARGAWGFYLYPQDSNYTWLIARSAQGNTHAGNKLLRYFFYEVPHFIMERKMLITLKKVIEKQQQEPGIHESLSDH